VTSTPGKGGSPRNRTRSGSGSSPSGRPNGSGSSGSGSTANGNGQRKRTSAAGSTSDEVTIKAPSVDSDAESASDTDTEPDAPRTDEPSKPSSNGAVLKPEPSDKAEDTVVDLAAKRPSSNDTVVDLAVGSVTAAASRADDKLVAGDGKAKSETESGTKGERTPSEGKTPAMDFSAPSPGYGGSTSTTRTTGSPSFTSRGPSQFDSTPPPPTPPGTANDFALTGPDRSGPPAVGSKRAPRKAHLQVARLEPWSVMKFSLVMSAVCFIVLFVAVTVLYMILSGLGVFDSLASTIRDLTSSDSTNKTGGVNPAGWFSAERILGYTALLGVLNVLLITALATVWSVIYNLAADLVGGVEVTLKEAE
jgi:Transmembrane domain of unknown function (DUF3566)